MKWYEDPVYARMADCPEIQGQHTSWDVHDFYVFADGQNESPFHGIWLPTQSQLQGMVYGDGSRNRNRCWYTGQPEPRSRWLVQTIDAFWECYNPPDCQSTKYYDRQPPNYTEQFDSMEQLWMAFVMKELHGKIWDGSKWV